MRVLKIIGPLLLMAIWASLLSAENRGRVRVHVEDFSGAPLPAYITITELGTKKRAAYIKSEERKDASTTIPYGRYVLTIEAPGFRSYERQLKVLGSAAYVRAALTVADADERRVVGPYFYPFIHGSVQGNLPEKADLWAKLIPLTNSEDNLMDAKIGKDRRFQFDGMDAGNYLILIIDDRRVLATEQVESAANKVVTITIP